MIQRIQSLYLLLTTLLSLLFLKGSFLNFIDKSGSVIKITFGGIIKDTGEQGFEVVEKLLPLTALIILIPAISLVIIFIFKNRKIQLWLALSVIILIVGFIFVSIFYSWFVITEYGTEIVPGFKMVIPVLILIFAILAYRGIRKDDRLIKSYDRLR
ncbi:MAG: DUF4293 domain-containing protein [Bacteroidales bacterium]|nr:DUF4293 domain-containing protein [Bacteroidales bacterium]